MSFFKLISSQIYVMLIYRILCVMVYQCHTIIYNLNNYQLLLLYSIVFRYRGESHRRLRTWIREFLEKEIFPNALKWEAEGMYVFIPICLFIISYAYTIHLWYFITFATSRSCTPRGIARSIRCRLSTNTGLAYTIIDTELRPNIRRTV